MALMSDRTEWRELPIEGSQLAGDGVVRVYWAEVGTPPDETPPDDGLINQPYLSLQELGVTEEWKIVSTVANHHRALWPRIFIMLAVLAEEEQTVHLTMVHHTPKRKA